MQCYITLCKKSI